MDRNLYPLGPCQISAIHKGNISPSARTIVIVLAEHKKKVVLMLLGKATRWPSNRSALLDTMMNVEKNYSGCYAPSET